jgi:cold shock protein
MTVPNFKRIKTFFSSILKGTSTPSGSAQTKGSEIKKGVVKFFNRAKGFGFITTDNGAEVFVHSSGLRDKIRQNDLVNFELQQGSKGLSAINVRVS